MSHISTFPVKCCSGLKVGFLTMRNSCELSIKWQTNNEVHFNQERVVSHFNLPGIFVTKILLLHLWVLWRNIRICVVVKNILFCKSEGCWKFGVFDKIYISSISSKKRFSSMQMDQKPDLIDIHKLFMEWNVFICWMNWLK